MNAPQTDLLDTLRARLRGVILGKEDVIELMLVGVLAGGHVLLEDVPGVGKTTLAKALAIVLRLEYIVRAGKVSFDNARKAYNLTNKCSKCKCIGHNKQNHDDALDRFLTANSLINAANDTKELVEIADDNDSWFGSW